MSDQPAPIIIKRKKVIAGGHHGGAWKVAIWRSPVLWRLFALVSETSFGRASHSDSADHDFGSRATASGCALRPTPLA
jgi:hypothetical protein